MSGTTSGQDYNFLFGLLKQRERELLDFSVLRSLLAQPAASIAAALPEGPLSERLRKNLELGALNEGIQEELDALRSLLQKYGPSPDLRRIAVLPWDYHNLKIASLGALEKKPVDALYAPEGDVPVALFKRAGEDLEFGTDLPEALYDDLQAALLAFYEADRNTQAFEASLDAAKNRRLCETGDRLSAEIGAFFRLIRDARNVLVFLRARAAELPWLTIKYQFDGLKKPTGLSTLYAAETSAMFVNAIDGQVWSELIRDFAAGTSIGALEASAFATAEKRMESWKFRSAGPEYAAYFVIRKMTTLDNLRMILAGRLLESKPEELERRLRHVHV